MADNIRDVAVQWKITFDVADNILVFKAVLVMSLRILKSKIFFKLYFE